MNSPIPDISKPTQVFSFFQLLWLITLQVEVGSESMQDLSEVAKAKRTNENDKGNEYWSAKMSNTPVWVNSGHARPSYNHRPLFTVDGLTSEVPILT